MVSPLVVPLTVIAAILVWGTAARASLPDPNGKITSAHAISVPVVLAPEVDAAPAQAPPPRADMGMAYDPARGQVVLFGGYTGSDYLGDTWTWDGTEWTQRYPAHAPSPRVGMGMTYDAASGQVVLFGGVYLGDYLGDTWTWDGTDWTQRHPAHAPSQRAYMGTAYDDAPGQVMLFGGIDGGIPFGDTWTWDGADWTQQHPAHAPSARYDLAVRRLQRRRLGRHLDLGRCRLDPATPVIFPIAAMLLRHGLRCRARSGRAVRWL
jgi:hypothetical protein